MIIPSQRIALNQLCIHSTPNPSKPTGVICTRGYFGGMPHVAMCKSCKEYRPGPRRLILPNTHRPQIRFPARRILSVEEKQLAQSRAVICRACPHNGHVTLEKNGWPVYNVSCKLCGCGGLSLLNGACKANKWPSSARVNVKDVSSRRRLLLKSFLSPGDIVMLTAAVRDLHQQYPNQFQTAVQTSCEAIWEHNPYITKIDNDSGNWQVIDMHYPLINESNHRPVHFIHGYIDYLSSVLGISIKPMGFKGDIHISEDEKQWQNQVEQTFGYKGKYWIMVAGGKYDFTAKWWPPEFYQKVIDHFLGRVQFVQCGEKNHWHPSLRGVFSLVGQTDIRQFIRLMYHAEGVVCPVTFAMHLAAAVPTKADRLRPCVVIAGGREPPHWEAYPGHQFLHTIGMLPCCASGGCWRSRCQPVGDGNIKDTQNMCERPVQIAAELRIPQCMLMIKPENVIRAIEDYRIYNL